MHTHPSTEVTGSIYSPRALEPGTANMEQGMKATSAWSGPVGLRLGDILYVKAWSDDDLTASVDHLVEEVRKRITKK